MSKTKQKTIETTLVLTRPELFELGIAGMVILENYKLFPESASPESLSLSKQLYNVWFQEATKKEKSEMEEKRKHYVEMMQTQFAPKKVIGKKRNLLKP